MRHQLAAVLFAMLASACGSEPPEPSPDFCEGRTRQRYDPGSFELLAWPDDALAESAETSTGIRLTNDVPWIGAKPLMVAKMLESIAGPTGFPRQGAAMMRFSDDVGLSPYVNEEPTLHDDLLFFEWKDGSLDLVPFVLHVDDEGRQIRAQPLRPLRAATPHMLLLRREHTAADGECVGPAKIVRDLLSGDEPSGRLGRVHRQLHEAIEVAGVRLEDVSAAVTFTTHDDLAMFAQIARSLHDDPPEWITRPTCVPDGDRRRCDGTFLGRDFRSEGAIEGTSPTGTWEVPVTVWLPAEIDGPYPVVVYGHGLGSRRREGRTAARRLAPHGIAVAAVDALLHGEHPTATEEGFVPLDFLGIDLDGPGIDGRTLRGNFVQTALDRVQAAVLLQSDLDVDGDGAPDLDPDRFAYWGVSLGGMIGAIQLALSDHLDAAVLTLAGGHLIEFAMGGEVSFLIRALFLEELDGDEASLERVMLAAQAMADPGDPAVFGAHVRKDRLVGDSPPHVLMPVALYDEIVPPSTGRAIARAFGLPHAEPIFERVPLLPPAGPLPLLMNAGDHTAAFLQLDTVGDPPEQARHANTSQASEVREQSRHFFVSWASDGEAEIPKLEQ